MCKMEMLGGGKAQKAPTGNHKEVKKGLSDIPQHMPCQSLSIKSGKRKINVIIVRRKSASCRENQRK